MAKVSPHSGNPDYRYQWTIEDFRKIVSLWSTTNTAELAKMLGKSRAAISSIATRLRKEGIHIPRKRINGKFEELMKQLKSELK